MDMIDSSENKSQFELVYRKYRKLMQYIAYDILHDHQLAEDAVSEIAELMNCSYDTVKKRLQRGRQEILRIYEERGSGENE